MGTLICFTLATSLILYLHYMSPSQRESRDTSHNDLNNMMIADYYDFYGDSANHSKSNDENLAWLYSVYTCILLLLAAISLLLHLRHRYKCCLCYGHY